MNALTPHHIELLKRIAAMHERIGRAPTLAELVQEIANGDHTLTRRHVDLLRRWGYIRLSRRAGEHHATVRLLHDIRDIYPARSTFLFLGAIPAGSFFDRSEEFNEKNTRIEDLVPGIRPGDFFLTVDGDSMIDAGLQHGQYVVIRPGLFPQNGDICAVWVEGLGSTLKKVYIDGETVRLVPANKKYHTMYVPAEQVLVQGVLVAALAIRNFRNR